PLPTHLGALGMPGWTAYFGLFEVGAIKPGETVVVSAAAGAVGSVAGQLAKHHRCRTVGIAGGPEKCAMLTDTYGFDAAIDYKNDDLRAALKAAAPDRVDVYLDNVGGDILDAVLGRLAMHARIPLCGGISQYNAGTPTGPANYLAMIAARATMTGFLVFDYSKRYDEAIAYIAPLIAEGKLVAREHVVEAGGVEHGARRVAAGAGVVGPAEQVVGAAEMQVAPRGADGVAVRPPIVAPLLEVADRL
ncbi:MAG: hypothetical protein QOI47_880, partial [Actinomycetota bacterium]|nr:hypothetical protein [Actinomycetota bacterium]